MTITRRTPFLRRQNLSDLLDNSFKMMGLTWKTSLVLSLVFFLPLSALVGWVAGGFLAGLANLASAAEGPSLMFLPGYARLLLAMMAVYLLLGLAGVFVQTAVSAHVAAAAGGRSPELPEIVRLAGRRFFLPCLLQQLVQVALFMGLVTLLLGATVPFLALAVAGKAFLPASVAGVSAAVLLGAAAVIWLSVLQSFAPQAVVFDGQGVFGSLQHSARLVRGSWWRLAGISIVVGFIFSFAAGLLTLPVTGAALLPLVSRLVGLTLNGNFETAELMQIFQGNQPPVAMDVHNRIPVWVRVADGGTLLRGGAWDIENDRLSFAWTILRQPEKATAVLETPSQPACKVRGMTVAGDYVFRLTLSDGTNTVTAEHTVPVYP